MQNIHNPDALQYVQSMEIDLRGWMWILDVGRRNFADANSSLICNGPAKLVIWDMNANCIVKTHVFPNHVLPWNNSFANDIVVDQTRGFAYISDTTDRGGIIVYSFEENYSWRFDHPSLGGNNSLVVYINGIKYDSIHAPSDGIALSRDTEILYYSSISKKNIYSIPTFVLRNKYTPNRIVGKYVTNIGPKYGYCDGLASDSSGNIYYGDFETSSIYKWKIGSKIESSIQLISSPVKMQWPDTFAWSGQYLYFSSNRLQLYMTNTMKFDGSEGSNFRIWKIKLNTSSYLNFSIPVPSQLPCPK